MQKEVVSISFSVCVQIASVSVRMKVGRKLQPSLPLAVSEHIFRRSEDSQLLTQSLNLTGSCIFIIYPGGGNSLYWLKMVCVVPKGRFLAVLVTNRVVNVVILVLISMALAL